MNVKIKKKSNNCQQKDNPTTNCGTYFFFFAFHPIPLPLRLSYHLHIICILFLAPPGLKKLSK